MSEENVELVRQAYEAWNRGDLRWMLDHVTPDFEFRTTHLFPDTEDVYRGRDGLQRFWNTFQGPWETFFGTLESNNETLNARDNVTCQQSRWSGGNAPAGH